MNNKFNECPVCFDDYVDSKFQILACSHKICEVCYPKLILCPFCRLIILDSLDRIIKDDPLPYNIQNILNLHYSKMCLVSDLKMECVYFLRNKHHKGVSNLLLYLNSLDPSICFLTKPTKKVEETSLRRLFSFSSMKRRY